MRKSVILLLTLAPLLGFGALALPAVADSDSGSCAALPAAGPLNLDLIPAKPVTGKLSVRGVGDDDDCAGALSANARGSLAIGENDDDEPIVGRGDNDD